MNLYTPIDIPALDITLDIGSRVMLLGSCFSDEVGERLRMSMGEDKVDVNPFGVLYNPISIAQAIRLLMSDEDIDKWIFEGRDSLWHSWLHSSHFSSIDRETCLRLVQERINEARENFKKADILIITFGTTRAYQLKEASEEGKDIIVANCHKELATRFTEIDPKLNELISDWTVLIEEIKSSYCNKKILFTVSPYRYRKYGFHESQIQKSKLLLLVDTLCHKFDAQYFPSYEIVLDELRDYRFYAKDMLHPSDLAVDIITEKFKECTFTEQLMEKSKLNIKNYKSNKHIRITK